MPHIISEVANFYQPLQSYRVMLWCLLCFDGLDNGHVVGVDDHMPTPDVWEEVPDGLVDAVQLPPEGGPLPLRGLEVTAPPPQWLEIWGPP